MRKTTAEKFVALDRDVIQAIKDSTETCSIDRATFAALTVRIKDLYSSTNKQYKLLIACKLVSDWQHPYIHVPTEWLLHH